MKTKKKKNYQWLWLIIVVAIGAFLRFYKLDWGDGYFFHPDEYHIAGAVERLSFPSRMNPELFSYGSFTVYLIYFTRLLMEKLSLITQGVHPILLGRYYSAFFSTLTVVIVYLIAKELFSKKSYWNLTALLAALTPGLIQQAHFTTPESFLTFWLFLTILFWILWIRKNSFKWILFSAASLGLALGTKIVAMTFVSVFPIIFAFHLRPISVSKLVRRIILFLGFLAILALIFLSVFPYSFLDWETFRSSINYETGVGRGDPVVFYTRQFVDTTPFLFQFERILPYALGPIVLIFGLFGLVLILVELITSIFISKRKINYSLLIVVLAFGSYFISNASLFAKWTRFIAPAFPFFPIFAVYFVAKIFSSKAKVKKFRTYYLSLVYLLLGISIVWSMMFFSIYLRPDVRMSATLWINSNISPEALILTEAGNMVEAPIQGGFLKKPLDFYHLEERVELQKELPEFIYRSDYFIVQSRRMFMNHQRLADQFPKTSRFYDLLFSGVLGFEKVKEFNSFPKLRFVSKEFVVNDEIAEETWSVFDHPVVRVYKKVKILSQNDYEKLLEI